jgi:hypothetical protein
MYPQYNNNIKKKKTKKQAGSWLRLRGPSVWDEITLWLPGYVAAL